MIKAIDRKKKKRKKCGCDGKKYKIMSRNG
jgi:hypothetical protein